MAYLTDKEKRLLFSALTREKKVCVEVDKEYCREPYEVTLESVVKNLEKKFYYDRFEKEIRAKAINEFAEKLKETLNTYIEDAKDEGDYTYIEPFEISKRAVKEVAEQLKEGEKYDN